MTKTLLALVEMQQEEAFAPARHLAGTIASRAGVGWECY